MYGPRGSIVSNEIPWVQQMPPVPENLVMDREIQFAKKKTLTVTHNAAILLLLAFFGCVIAVGLLVFYLAPCPNGSSPSKESLNSGNATVVVIDESTEKPPEQTTLEPSISETTTTEIWTTTPQSSGRYVRLPRSVTPKEYNLTFVPFLSNFTFTGTVSILLNVTEPTRNITIHALELTIDDTSVQVTKVDGGGISGKKYETDKELQFFVVQFEKELDVGEYVIRMNYTGILNDVLQGFYRSSYRWNNETRWLAATQFQPTDARRAFPCFDEPALKATFKISIARPGNMSSVSNMPKFKTEPALGIPDYEWDHFQKSVPMSTYLVAFVVSDFKPRSNKNFSVWARGDAYDQTVYSMDFGPKVLKFYEEFFKIPFPLPKIDMFAIPDFSAGAMENWGLITYRESTLLYEDNISTRRNKQRIATVIAHELGHQWFGNLVTPSWWTDLWLNEGFATYLEYIGTNAVNPEWKMLDQFVNELHSVFELDALKSSHQISIEVNDPDEISYIFDKISYGKGATIIRMMEHFLTTDVFKRGLTNYLKANEYGNAEQNDLWKFLTDEGHKEGVLEPNMNVKAIMDTWTLQTGYPVINVARNYKRGGARFTQSRFLVNTNSTDPNNSLWWVPITYKSPTTNVTKTWLRKEQQVTISYAARSNEWLLVNVNQTGYYRVNYDRHNWEMLVQQLKKDHGVFDPKNRAQIIDDAFNLANAGLLDYNIALNISTYLTQEKELVPWTAAFSEMDYIYEMFLRSGKFEKFKNYLMHLITPLYKNVGFRDGYSDPLLLTSIRNCVLMRACKLGLRDCVDNAARQFQNWKATQDPDKYNPISPNLKGVVYCTAIRVGGEEEWDFAWQRYLNTNVGSERELLLGALGCTREAWLLNKYLNLAVTEGSGIRKQDATSVFSHVSNNIVGQPLAFAFVTSQWERVKNYLGTSFSSVNAIIRYVANNFNTELEMENVRSFATKRAKDLGAASRSIKQSLESIETNIQWMEQHYQTIVTWLEESEKSWS